MTVTRLKPLGNFRASPVKTSTPEPIEIEGGVALLAEAPADPGSPSWPMVVTVNGTPRVRVTGTPAAGQFKVQTQTVIGANGQAANEYLPLLQFHESDEGLAGTCDYWQSGSVLTAQFFSTLVSFLTPLTGYASIDALPPPTSAQTVRGRPGDIAFLTSGEMVYSDGASWMVFSGSTPTLSGGLTLGAAISMALDAGYVGPSLDGAAEFGDVHSFATDAGYVLGVAADETFDAILGLTMDAVIAHVGADSHASAHGFEGDASFAPAGLDGTLTLGQSIAFALDAAYEAGGGSASFSDDFNRANGALGSDYTAVPTMSAPQIANNGVATVGAAYVSAQAFSADQYVEGTLTLHGSLLARVSSTERRFYALTLSEAEGFQFLALSLYGPSTATSLCEFSVYAGHRYRLEVRGSVITVKAWNGASWITLVGTPEEHTPLVSGAPGLRVEYSGGSVDSFAAGDL